MSGDIEIRRVREAMSAAAGHDVRVLIARINERKRRCMPRIFDPGTQAEQSGPCAVGTHAEPMGSSSEEGLRTP